MGKIWVVDDEPSILVKLEKILRKQKYEVRCFNKPEELFAALELDQPSLIIADLFYKNSQLTGETVVSHVVSNYSPTQVVIISGEKQSRHELG